MTLLRNPLSNRCWPSIQWQDFGPSIRKLCCPEGETVLFFLACEMCDELFCSPKLLLFISCNKRARIDAAKWRQRALFPSADKCLPNFKTGRVDSVQANRALRSIKFTMTNRTTTTTKKKCMWDGKHMHIAGAHCVVGEVGAVWALFLCHRACMALFFLRSTDGAL